MGWLWDFFRGDGFTVEGDDSRSAHKFREVCDEHQWEGPWQLTPRDAAEDSIGHRFTNHWGGDRRGGEDRRRNN